MIVTSSDTDPFATERGGAAPGDPLQAKHGNKWKRIAAEVPGRTAKRLGKWWEVLKEKQRRRDARSPDEPRATHQSYNWLLERFAEKLVGDPMLMAPAPVLPPWLATGSSCNDIVAETRTTQLLHRPPSPSVTLSLAASEPWSPQPSCNEGLLQVVDVGRTASELVERCQEAAMERVEAEHRERAAALRRDAESKQEKMGEHWAAKAGTLGW